MLYQNPATSPSALKADPEEFSSVVEARRGGDDELGAVLV